MRGPSGPREGGLAAAKGGACGPVRWGRCPREGLASLARRRGFRPVRRPVPGRSVICHLPSVLCFGPPLSSALSFLSSDLLASVICFRPRVRARGRVRARIRPRSRVDPAEVHLGPRLGSLRASAGSMRPNAPERREAGWGVPVLLGRVLSSLRGPSFCALPASVALGAAACGSPPQGEAARGLRRGVLGPWAGFGGVGVRCRFAARPANSGRCPSAAG